jgi:hypothetical protein
MKAVVMNQDEIVSWGPRRLLTGETTELPDDLAASLVGRGLAVYAAVALAEVAVVEAPKTENKPAQKPGRKVKRGR